MPWEQHSLRVGVSMGVASLDPEMPNVAAWVKAADAACYAAKAMGRGAVHSASHPGAARRPMAPEAAGHGT